MNWWDVILGVIPAVPVYYGARHLFLRKKPVVYRTAPSTLTPIIAQYHQRQLEIEGKVVPAAIEQAKAIKANSERPVTVLEQNYAKWSSNKAQIPLVVESLKVLQTLSAMSSLNLTIEERHNLEVLSGQTDELLTNFFNTPEAIRTMPAVEHALHEQLVQIEAGVSSIQVNGAEDFIRNLRVGTEFIKTKFNSK
jgi:hypothetical protein